MFKTELVLSNTTTFFSGNIENVFKKARKYGFKYLEILPYRWTTVQEILDLETRYQIKVVGIHLPPGYQKNLWEKTLNIIWSAYLGNIGTNIALQLAQEFKKRNRGFYLLFHSDLANEVTKFQQLIKDFPIIIENAPYHKNISPTLWNSLEIFKSYPNLGHVFDPGHFYTIPQNLRPNIYEVYSALKPRVVHISYNNGFAHTLPSNKERDELLEMLKIHKPEYIVLETNPLVNVKKGKEILERIIQASE